MRSTEKSRKLAEVDIKDYYALNIGAMWRGLRMESWSFWWLCIYLLFEYVKPQSIYAFIDFLPWTQLSLLFALLTLRSDPSVQWVKSRGTVLLLIFYSLVFLSCIYAFQPSIAWEKISIVINWIILYFLMISLINSEKRFFIFMLLFLLVNFKMSQHGARTFVMRGFSFADWGVSGSPGWFQNAGDFGLQMTIFVPLAMGFILALKEYWGRGKKFLVYLLPLTGMITILGSSSRGALLAIACVAVWFIIKSRVGFKGVLGILIVGWALYSIAPDEMVNKFEAAGDDYTSKARIVYWYYGLDVVKKNPVLGVGYENWIEYCWSEHRYGIDGNKYGVDVGKYVGTNTKRTIFCLNPHNTLIETAAQVGIPALVVYLSLCLFILSKNAQTRKIAQQSGNKLISNLAHGLDGGLIGYLVASMFLTVVFYPIFWVQLAMTVALHNIAKKQLANLAADEPDLASIKPAGRRRSSAVMNGR